MKFFGLFKKKRKPLVPPKGAHLYKVRFPDGTERVESFRIPSGWDPRDVPLPEYEVNRGWFGKPTKYEFIRGVDDPEEEVSKA